MLDGLLQISWTPYTYKYKNFLKKLRGCRVRCGIEDIKSTETRYNCHDPQ